MSNWRWIGSATVLVMLVAICIGGIWQAQAIADLRERVEHIEERVTASNQRAWAPWSKDVTERLERIEQLIRRGRCNA